MNFTRYRTFYHAAKSGLKVSVERGNFFIEVCRKKFQHIWLFHIEGIAQEQELEEMVIPQATSSWLDKVLLNDR